jgi:predicted transcriptional regulator
MSAGRPTKRTAELKSTFVSTQVDVRTKGDLDDLARQDDSSLSRLVRQAIIEYIERRKAVAA